QTIQSAGYTVRNFTSRAESNPLSGLPNRDCVPRRATRGAWMKRDLTRFPALTPESLRTARPCGPVRFSLHHASERERPDLYREFFGRTVMGVDVQPIGEAAFEAEVLLQPLPGLQIFSGRVHGSRNRRTPALLADGRGDFTLMINLGGPYLVSQGA